jgi:predicted aspartyl protease
MRLAIVAAFVVTAVCGPQAFAETCEPLKKYTTMPFRLGDEGRIYVPATVAGRQTHLMVDTGAYWSSLNQDMAQALNLTTRMPAFEMRDATGERMRKSGVVPEVKIGTLNFGAAEFFVNNHNARGTIEQDGGIMGRNFMTQVDVEIDNAGKTVSLFSPIHCRGDGVYWADEAVTLEFKKAKANRPLGTRIRQTQSKEYANQIDTPAVTAMLEGEAVTVLFDTGATHTFMDKEFARRRMGITETSPGAKPAGKAYASGGGETDVFSYVFSTLTIGGIKFENVTARIGDFDNDTHVILGMNEMKHLRLYFAFRDGMIHVTYANASRQPN